MREMRPIGRDAVLSRLEPLPVSTVLRAPPSTGKRTTAAWVARQAGVYPADIKVFPEPFLVDERGRRIEPSAEGTGSLFTKVEPELNVEMVRELVRWAKQAPLTRAGKVAIIRLDHTRADGSSWSAADRCCHALLKIVEEPPPTIRFVFCASGPVLAPIVSRSVSLQAGLLSLDEVAQILDRVSDLTMESAYAAAVLGAGRVAPALHRRTKAGRAVETVRNVLVELSEGNHDALTGRTKEWSVEDTDMLVQWSYERVLDRPSVFTHDDLALLPRRVAQRILASVRNWDGARPRLMLGGLLGVGTA